MSSWYVKTAWACAHPYTHIHILSQFNTHTHACAHRPPEYTDFPLVYQTVAINFRNKNWEKKLIKIYT